MKKNKKIFILGSSGLIGKAACQSLSTRQGFDVVSLGRSSADVHFDLVSSSSRDLTDMMSAGDFLLMLAAVSSADECTVNFEYSWSVNVSRTIELIESVARLGANIIFCSSDVVLAGYNEISNENFSLYPIGNYALMKSAVELKFRNVQNVKIARLSYVASKYDKFSALLFDSVLLDKKVTVFKGFERNIVTINDVLLGFENLITDWDDFDFQVVNFSGKDLLSREVFASMLQARYPEISFSVEEAPSTFWKTRKRVINTCHKRFGKLLGKQPQSLQSYIFQRANLYD